MNLETHIAKELWLAVRRNYESESWSAAILDAIYFLSDTLRNKTGLQSDGTALVGQALGGKSPKLRLNRLQTESEQNVQAGTEQLLRGLYSAIRNPRSHGRIADTSADAEAIIVFVDYLLRVIGHARAEFVLDACVSQILEENFVPDARYAELLVSEIPPRHRLQVVLNVLQSKTKSNGEKLGFFFRSVLPQLSPEEKAEVFRSISDELRETTDDNSIRIVFQILEPADWQEIAEIARLRIENRLIRALRTGRYDEQSQKCTAGSLVIWATQFFPHFTLKLEMLNAISAKLRGSREEQAYIFEHFLFFLEALADEPSPHLRLSVEKGLKAGDERFCVFQAFWTEGQWGDRVNKAFADFQETPSSDDDASPF